MTYRCSHTDDQRQLTGTWCTPELERAVAKGYVLQVIHEVWHFSNTRVGLFRDYVDTWLKLKVEASGWPRADMSEAEKQQYATDYETAEGIRLDPENIAHNPGMRVLAKLMLNSMWGKFGQRLDRQEVKEFVNPQDFSEFLDSHQFDVRYVSVLSEHRVEVHYATQTEDIPVAPNLNIFVACFTTCWARLKLYDALDVLRERVLYYDTDSVLFTQRPH